MGNSWSLFGVYSVSPYMGKWEKWPLVYFIFNIILACIFSLFSQVYYCSNFEYEITDNKDDRLNNASLQKHLYQASLQKAVLLQRYMYQQLTTKERCKYLIQIKEQLLNLIQLKLRHYLMHKKKMLNSSLKLLNMEHLKNHEIQENYIENLTVAEECFKTLASCKDNNSSRGGRHWKE